MVSEKEAEFGEQRLSLSIGALERLFPLNQLQQSNAFPKRPFANAV